MNSMWPPQVSLKKGVHCILLVVVSATLITITIIGTGFQLSLDGQASSPNNLGIHKAVRTWGTSAAAENKNGPVAKHVNDFDWRTTIESGPVASLPGTTGPGVPGRIRSWLTSTGVPIDDDAQDHFGSEAAVRAMEEGVCGGWDAGTSSFRNASCVDALNFGPYENTGDDGIASLDPSEIDIVTPSIRNLDFLNEWREFFQGFHVIIIQDGNQSKFLEVPDWVDYELHKRADIEEALGENEWIISRRDASIRNYGFLLSKKRYIFTIDDDCRPSYDSRGHKVNPLAFHFRNLKTPSTPYMFNTLYDPYAEGSDFVRGYPYSLRAGVPTGVSHGLWMNQPDYDAPTQLLKVRERVSRMHEMTQTIPAGILFPLCSMNVAFDRELIGPAMMQGLMGDGQPWARYDDMFSGWAAKSIADHLGVGIKSGMPYIRHDKASNPFVNLKKEFLGFVSWQEIMLRFFMTDVSYSSRADTPSKAYKELAGQIRAELRGTHEYFDRLATSMEIWTDCWDSAAKGEIVFSPSRQAQPNLEPINLDYYSEDVYGTKPGLNLNLVRNEEFWAIKVGTTVVSHRNKLKIYVYDLPFEHSLENHLRTLKRQTAPKSNCDWNTNICAEEERVGRWSATRQYGGDAVLIRKFRRYADRVYDADEADLFVVPYPHSSICRLYTAPCLVGCSKYCGTRSAEIEDDVKKMLGGLEHFDDNSKNRHLFLLTGDANDHHSELSSMPLYVSLGGKEFPGSTNIVVPPPNTEPDYQPSSLARFDWNKPRSVAVFMKVELANEMRENVYSHLEKIPSIGGLPVELHRIPGDRNSFLGVQDTWKKYRESYFCPIIQGDTPYQKSFFDAALSGCLPVVVASPSSGGSLGYNHTHPFPSSIDYSEFVVELDGVEETAPRLESLLADKPKIRAMQSALGRAAKKFVYGLGDEFMEPGDAFDSLLIELESYVSRLDGGADADGGESAEERSAQPAEDGAGGTDADGSESVEERSAQPAEDGAAASTYLCGDCIWADGVTCAKRVAYFTESYGLDENTAMKEVLEKYAQCRATH